MGIKAFNVFLMIFKCVLELVPTRRQGNSFDYVHSKFSSVKEDVILIYRLILINLQETI